MTEPRESLAMIEQALTGQAGAATDIVALNAGASLYAADRAKSLAQGVGQAQAILASGKAWRRMQDLVALSKRLAPPEPELETLP